MGSEMESETLDPMNYIKIISKEKKTVNRIIKCLHNNYEVSRSWSRKESVEVNLLESQAKGVMDELQL